APVRRGRVHLGGGFARRPALHGDPAGADQLGRVLAGAGQPAPDQLGVEAGALHGRAAPSGAPARPSGRAAGPCGVRSPVPPPVPPAAAGSAATVASVASRSASTCSYTATCSRTGSVSSRRSGASAASTGAAAEPPGPSPGPGRPPPGAARSVEACESRGTCRLSPSPPLAIMPLLRPPVPSSVGAS